MPAVAVLGSTVVGGTAVFLAAGDGVGALVFAVVGNLQNLPGPFEGSIKHLAAPGSQHGRY